MKKNWRMWLIAVVAIVGLALPFSGAFAHHQPGIPVGGETNPEKTAEHEAGEEGGGPKDINWADFSNPEQKPFLAAVLNFAILCGLYYFMGRKPIAEALKNRRAAVAKEIDDANRMLREAQARAKQYQGKIEHLEEELATAKSALMDAGRGERDRIIKEAEEKAARMQKDAEFLIEQEIKQMRQDLWRETVDVAVTTAEELLKKRITPSDQERLAEDYLEDLAGRQKRTPSLIPAKGGAS